MVGCHDKPSNECTMLVRRNKPPLPRSENIPGLTETHGLAMEVKTFWYLKVRLDQICGCEAKMWANQQLNYHYIRRIYYSVKLHAFCSKHLGLIVL